MLEPFDCMRTLKALPTFAPLPAWPFDRSLLLLGEPVRST
jgi:hypothetical protein